MIDLKQEQVEAIMEKAIDRLSSSNAEQLVSITKEIENKNPLLFFEGAKCIDKNRTFWKNTVEDFTLVGVGRAYEITAEERRFAKTEKCWERLQHQAIIYNPYQLPGTGLTALGGMKFDPEKKTTSLWSNFKTSQFTVPEFMLTCVNNRTFLTTNIIVKKEDHPVQLASTLKQLENKLFENNRISNTNVTIKEKAEIDVQTWKNTIQKIKEEIKTGKAEKIVLAREVRIAFDKQVNISTILNSLLKTQPNSYVFAFEEGEDCFVGATPERLVKVEQNELLSTCLAGTAPRGKTKEEDERIGTELLHDEKNRQEHDFVVKMIKDAVSRYCTNVNIPDAPVLYRLKNLQHLYTPVTAKLKKGYSILDVVEKLHPTPALGGTPKEESLAFIRQYEQLDRGWYGAPIGWIDSNRCGEFAVAIRSALIQGDEASLFAGCGIVENSDPDSEYKETAMKLLPMLTVLGGKN